MAKSLQQKYNAKKRNTLSQRSCGFELTFEEYSNLINRATVCDYTGVKLTATGKHVASIERIDASKPYHVDNCCMVSRHVNSLKDHVEKGLNSTLKMEDIVLIDKIKETLATKTSEDLVRKYKVSCPDRPHSDVSVTKKYLQFSESNPSHNLSFSRFKSLVGRKTCCWSRRVFEEHRDLQPQLITTTGEHNDEDTTIVCGIIARMYNLDMFTKDQMVRIATNFNK